MRISINAGSLVPWLEVGPTDWDKLAQLLGGERFPVLKKLELKFGGQIAMTVPRDEFSQLEARGVFKCTVIDAEWLITCHINFPLFMAHAIKISRFMLPQSQG
jgi:hypothetical protein